MVDKFRGLPSTGRTGPLDALDRHLQVPVGNPARTGELRAEADLWRPGPT